MPLEEKKESQYNLELFGYQGWKFLSKILIRNIYFLSSNPADILLFKVINGNTD